MIVKRILAIGFGLYFSQAGYTKNLQEGVSELSPGQLKQEFVKMDLIKPCRAENLNGEISSKISIPLKFQGIYSYKNADDIGRPEGFNQFHIGPDGVQVIPTIAYPFRPYEDKIYRGEANIRFPSHKQYPSTVLCHKQVSVENPDGVTLKVDIKFNYQDPAYGERVIYSLEFDFKHEQNRNDTNVKVTSSIRVEDRFFLIFNKVHSKPRTVDLEKNAT